jgi:hypothetical protein
VTLSRARGVSDAGVGWLPAALKLPSGFRAAAPDAASLSAADCGHAHAPDPAELERAFSWRDATGRVIAAGVRPCSGAAQTRGLIKEGLHRRRSLR